MTCVALADREGQTAHGRGSLLVPLPGGPHGVAPDRFHTSLVHCRPVGADGVEAVMRRRRRRSAGWAARFVAGQRELERQSGSGWYVSDTLALAVAWGGDLELARVVRPWVRPRPLDDDLPGSRPG